MSKRTSTCRRQRHQPENTLLDRIVEQHFPAFLAHLEAEGRSLPDYVLQEFTGYLKCGRLEHGFLRVRCERCHHEKLVAFSCKRSGFCPSCGARRTVESAALLVDEVLPARPIRQWVLTVAYPLRFLFAAYPELMSLVLGIVTRAISTHLARQARLTRQRFESALNLNIHFHMQFLDGVYVQDEPGHYGFRRTPPPTVEQLHDLLKVISQRVARFLERRGILERDEDNSYLTLDGLEEDPLKDIHGYSVIYRIAIGPQKGHKVFCLQTIPAQPEELPDNGRVAKLNGFSNTLLTLELDNVHTRGEVHTLGIDKNQTTSATRLFWTGWNERVQLLSVWNKLAQNQGSLTRVSRDYDWSDNWQFGMLWVNYSANHKSIYAPFRNNDMLQLNARFSFQN